jgi:hypothetical protein
MLDKEIYHVVTLACSSVHFFMIMVHDHIEHKLWVDILASYIFFLFIHYFPCIAYR